MKIRSITYFCNPRYPFRSEVLQDAGRFLRTAREAYEAAGYEVQTTRLATVPFAQLLGEKLLNRLPTAAQELELLLRQIAVEYASLGPALPQQPRSYEVIAEAMAGTQNVFFGGGLTQARGRHIDLEAVRKCAQVIVRCGPLAPNGFANLRFAALANVLPGSPFLPAAYHGGAAPAFAIATEAADLAVQSFAQASTVSTGQARLTEAIQKHADALSRTARALTGRAISRGKTGPRTAARFLGIDFSLASFPDEATSLGNAFERMGVARAGLHGSLAAAAVLTDAVDRARFRRTGFNGLMLPVMEDATFAKRAADGSLSIKDLLMYSAVCGTGLDTIPLPGDTTEAQIAAVLLDLAALALRLDKPLTARLMPIPGKKAGDATGFDFAFFSNSRVMHLDAEAVGGPLAAGGPIPLRSRRS
ncbi:MAG TPA: DUF711 family protein [Anaerolineales bacterium]|nr:DUF711 family protein [Anaerolineales bacterium]